MRPTAPSSPEAPAETALTRERVLVLVLALASAPVAYLVWRLVQPFVAPITWALVLAVIAHAMHERMKQHVRWPSVAAALAVVVVTLVIALPATFVVRTAGRQAMESVATIRTLVTEERWTASTSSVAKSAGITISSISTSSLCAARGGGWTAAGGRTSPPRA
jgi:predicted PurR-regulated permease PerM